MLKLAMHAGVACLVLAACGKSSSVAPSSAPASAALQTAFAVYDADPGSLWNRLHAALWVRHDLAGKAYGADRLDPLLWSSSTHLIDGPLHDELMGVLREFNAAGADAVAKDGVHRAMLQRELWAVLDWSTESPRFGDAGAKARITEMQVALARAMARVALSAEEIGALPDNYDAAIKARAFAADYDPANRGTAFLPPALFDADGPWVCVSSPVELTAPNHVIDFGRSVFAVYLRLPRGRAQTLEYLAAQRGRVPDPLPGSPGDQQAIESLAPELRQVPAGTQAVLVRQMVLMDDKGNLVPTHVTESVQIRVMRDFVPPAAPIDTQAGFEFELSRVQLFANSAGGLHARTPTERDFQNVQLQSLGIDMFSQETNPPRWPLIPLTPVTESCMGCHSSGPGAFLNSLRTTTTRRQLSQQAARQGIEHEAGKPDDAVQTMLRWKERQFSWGLVKGMLAVPAGAK